MGQYLDAILPMGSSSGWMDFRHFDNRGTMAGDMRRFEVPIFFDGRSIQMCLEGHYNRCYLSG